AARSERDSGPTLRDRLARDRAERRHRERDIEDLLIEEVPENGNARRSPQTPPARLAAPRVEEIQPRPRSNTIDDLAEDLWPDVEEEPFADTEIHDRYEDIKRGEIHLTELQRMTMPQLIAAAKQEGIAEYTGLKKQDLIFKILKERVKHNGLMYGE